MKTFDININSNKRAIPIAIIFFGISIHLMTLIPNDWPDIVVFGTIAILFFTPLIPVTILSRGKIRIELTKESFRTVWVKRFFLSNDSNVELSWNNIINYVNQEDRGLDSFRLTLTNNRQFKFYRYTYFPQKDDFDKFLIQFPKFLKKVNTTDMQQIKRGKTLFETPSFRWVLYGMTIITIGLLINVLLNPNSGTTWAGIGVIIFGIAFYWIQAAKKN